MNYLWPQCLVYYPVHTQATMVCIKKNDTVNIVPSFHAAISISQRVQLDSLVSYRQCITDFRSKGPEHKAVS